MLSESECQPGGLVLLPLIIVFPLLLVIAVTLAFFTTVFDLVRDSSSSFPPDDTHVPTFHVPKHRYPKQFHILLLFSLAVVFGGIHCSGWNLSFPTYAEQKLWRVTSLAVTLIPIAQLPFIIITFSRTTGRSLRFLPRVVTPYVDGFSSLFLFLCALAYVSARLVLLGLALALLRHLPPAAFTTISWTKFFPHFL